ncbi:MAG: O-succinylbenzoic acid--CoA ligase [Flavobacteriaceae bacterium]|jgi:O-succinylbenzoic acid--CoA ligase|tara:strand:+ start:88 stop:1179 length:1092 start_codon:yes stop_codon:yes gene_type:complete
MQTPHYSIIHNRFLLNGYYYDQLGLKQVAYSFIKEGDKFERYMGDFLIDWLDKSENIYMETSGTTTQPKQMFFKKQALVNSAIATGNFFNISVGDKALNCLPANFIAGRMMLIRAIILGLSLDLVSPSKNPFYKNDTVYDFVAMTPMQAFHSLAYLNQVNTLIVGGAYVSVALQNEFRKRSINAFETYGMTETLSHIAVRSMEDPPSEFTCLSHVSVTQDARKCLVVKVPLLNIENLVTNDQVELLDKNRFKLIGRVDNVINSGGIKLHPEQIERKLSEVLSQHYFIGSLSDSVLGQKVILAIAEKNEFDKELLKDQVKNCKSLSPYEMPKAIVFYNDFEYTHSGKIKRAKTLALQPTLILDL